MKTSPQVLKMIPVDQIEILNPRDRKKAVFDEIVSNIETIGLKKPISVAERHKSNGDLYYILICGEGRLTAFKKLGASEIPALIFDVSDEEAYIMSLMENIARRQPNALENLASIDLLQKSGYSKNEISNKTGLTPEYVNNILILLNQGEEQLIVAVESGRIPLTVAIQIVLAGNDQKAAQNALQEAYESGLLRGNNLLHAKKLMERRLVTGKKISKSQSSRTQEMTTTSLVRNYQNEVERQKQLIRRANLVQEKLLFLASALVKLSKDESFIQILHAAHLDTMPKYLADRIALRGL